MVYGVCCDKVVSCREIPKFPLLIVAVVPIGLLAMFGTSTPPGRLES